MLTGEREIYGNARVTEAVIDIRCVNRTNLVLRDVNILSKQLGDDALRQLGDDITRTELVEVTEELDPDGTQRTTRKPVGYGFKVGNQVVQARLNGLAVSRLHPYGKWELFLDQTRSTWREYCGIAGPLTITRLGVRYINSLPIGDPGIDDLARFLKLRPVTPWGLLSPPAAFFLQIRQPSDNGSVLVVNEATIIDASSGKASILLDLDASREERFAYNEDQMWNLLEDLHVQLRDAFEKAIDEPVREILR